MVMSDNIEKGREWKGPNKEVGREGGRSKDRGGGGEGEETGNQENGLLYHKVLSIYALVLRIYKGGHFLSGKITLPRGTETGLGKITSQV